MIGTDHTYSNTGAIIASIDKIIKVASLAIDSIIFNIAYNHLPQLGGVEIDPSAV